MFRIFALALIVASTASAEMTRWASQDFKIISVEASSRRDLSKASCFNRIEAALCLVDPPTSTPTSQPRPCLTGGTSYLIQLLHLYDRYPSHLKRMMCHLKRIYIEKEFVGSAYAGILREGEEEDGRVLGGIIGIRKSLLDGNFGFGEWASWKEQLNFGVSPLSVSIQSGLPTVRTSMKEPGDMLYFLIAHELGHVFDFANDLNSFTGCEDHSESCTLTPKPSSWAALSWKSFEDPLARSDFRLRDHLCSYFCKAGESLPALDQNLVYEGLSRSDFISPYAARYPTEDFADTFAFYTIMAERNASYVILTDERLTYDPIQRLKSDPQMQPKRLFIESFLKSTIKYPGE